VLQSAPPPWLCAAHGPVNPRSRQLGPYSYKAWRFRGENCNLAHRYYLDEIPILNQIKLAR